MTSKEFLNQPYALQGKIRVKEQKAKYYRELADSVSSPGFEEHYSASRNTNAPFVKYLQKADELEREIKEDYIRLADLKGEIDRAINVIEDENEAMVLRYRYVMMLSMKEIAKKMYYTLRWTQIIHVRAVAHFETLHPSSPHFI